MIASSYHALPMAACAIKLVCFDLGGVVVRICRSWAEGCAAAGLDLRGDDESLFNGTDGWYARRDLTNLYQTGQISSEEFAQRFSRMLHGLYSPEEVLTVHDAWMIDEYVGVGDVIDRIHTRGVQTAALSNTNEKHWSQLPRYKSFNRLLHRFASHEMGLAKPDEAIYRALEQRIGTSGGSILFFDDLEENVNAARDCGWHSERIDPHGDTASQILQHLSAYDVL